MGINQKLHIVNSDIVTEKDLNDDGTVDLYVFSLLVNTRYSLKRNLRPVKIRAWLKKDFNFETPIYRSDFVTFKVWEDGELVDSYKSKLIKNNNWLMESYFALTEEKLEELYNKVVDINIEEIEERIEENNKLINRLDKLRY